MAKCFNFNKFKKTNNVIWFLKNNIRQQMIQQHSILDNKHLFLHGSQINQRENTTVTQSSCVICMDVKRLSHRSSIPTSLPPCLKMAGTLGVR